MGPRAHITIVESSKNTHGAHSVSLAINALLFGLQSEREEKVSLRNSQRLQFFILLLRVLEFSRNPKSRTKRCKTEIGSYKDARFW